MNVTYGPGAYIRDNNRIEGKIILTEHKIQIVRNGEELAQTFVPLERIQRIRLSGRHMALQVRLNVMSGYQAAFEAGQREVSSLTQEIVKRRGLKKRFLRNEWYEIPL